MKCIIALAAVLLICQASLGAECVTVRTDGKPITAEEAVKPMPPPKPIVISGAFCGTAFGTSGIGSGSDVPTPLENAAVDLIDAMGHVVAETPTDRNGTFRFHAVPVGKYRATLPGFMKTEEVIEITSDNQRDCERPLFVTLVVSWECTPPSHISTVDPSARRR